MGATVTAWNPLAAAALVKPKPVLLGRLALLSAEWGCCRASLLLNTTNSTLLAVSWTDRTGSEAPAQFRLSVVSLTANC